jgi:hypothetical protein
MASAIITEATPTKNGRNRGWRRAANERVSLMARKLLKAEMVRPDVLCCPTCGLTLEVEPARARAARRVPALRLDGERGTARQPAGHGGARRRGADSLCPGQLYPILRMHFYGAYSESTVWDGVVSLAQSRQYFVALIVFLASIAVPIIKLAGLLYLVISARFGIGRRRRSAPASIASSTSSDPGRCSTSSCSRSWWRW